MIDKNRLLTDLQHALASGTVTADEVRRLLPAATSTARPEPASTTSKLSATDVMFYIAGIILYAALLSLIAQTWSDDSAALHIILSVGAGSVLWSAAYYFTTHGAMNDIRRGMTNALLLTGSLALATGGYITSNELIGGYGELNYFAGALTFLIVGALHIGFDRLVRRDIILFGGILYGVATVPAVLYGIIDGNRYPVDIWVAILVGAAGFLAYATRLVARTASRPQITDKFDSLSAFVGLSAMFVASFGDYDALWLIAMIFSILGIFYLSIRAQDKHLLGSASFFLVVSVVTISFKYFSGFGVTFSLLLATVGLLGAAAAATYVRKQYFN